MPIIRIIPTALFVACLSLTAPLAAETPPVPLVPAVSEVQWGRRVPAGTSGVIVLSEKASPAEHEAARLLAKYVERRFRSQWAIGKATETPANASPRVYLGQRETFPALDDLCREQNLSVPDAPEGYALKAWRHDQSVTAVVAGRSGRAVLYGQDTLFQLLGRTPDGLMIQEATIRDWPTIPLRGRPHPHYQYFLKPENFDCMATSRINFIDLRDGIYAFEPGANLNREDIGRIIRDAKARDLRVYAAVNCGVPAAEQDAVIRSFREFVELGADGLWASFDDKGAGEAPRDMVAKILALGREHGITGDAIAVTPPKGDYQTIVTKFNRAIVAVPGMERAVWYWTSVPCAEDLADGKAIGLHVRPSWWHNWPRVPHASFRVGSDRAYMPVFRLADGWNRPNEQELRAMGDYVHAVMPWDGWQSQQHYLVPMIGWWSWRPEQYSFEALRGRIYDMVFGPQQAATAATLDDSLKRIRSRFRFWSTHTEYAPHCPPRLKSLDDRAATEADLASLQGLCEKLRSSAASETLLEPKTLEEEYLTPMVRDLETGLAVTRAPYPEYWWPSHQDAILRAIYDGNLEEANRLIGGVRDRIRHEVSQIERTLTQVAQVRQYVAWWRKRAAASAEDLRNLLDKRQGELRERIAEYNKTVAPTSQMLSGLADPPVQVGTGVWERHNHVRAIVTPEPRETFWGDWIGGLHEHKGMKVAVFALAKHLPVNAGVHSELPVNVPISGRRDRLGLILYLADANKESFGLGVAKWRWSGYRAIRLLWGDRELWRADLGIPRLTGEWFVVHLPELPADLTTLPLRLRVEDYYSAKNNLEIVYVGPIRLLEFDRE